LTFSEEDPKLKEVVEEIVDMDVDLYFKGLGISFVDYRPKEVAYISVQGVKIQYSQSNIDQKVLFNINNFQVTFCFVTVNLCARLIINYWMLICLCC
jgi:hypothetical protein